MKKTTQSITQLMCICLTMGIALSCQKKDLSQPPTSTIEESSDTKEAVKVEPTTSLRAYGTTSSTNSFSSITTSKVPIVLVHGLFGFGREELLGLKYWGGGLKDLQEILKANGYPTFTSNVGPISSNYDRAIELYYLEKLILINMGIYKK